MLLDLSYLSYPLPPDIRRMLEHGDFARMAQVIERRMADPRTPETLKKRLTYALDTVRRLPAAYPYTPAEFLALAQEAIADFTQAEMETLRDDGTLDWHYIDGEVRYRRTALNNLLKTRAEYAERAFDEAARSTAATDALNAVIARMKEKGGLHVRFSTRVQMTVDSDRLTPGETLRVWLPLPVMHAQVKSAQLLASSHTPSFVAPEDEPQRTAYFELPYEPGMVVWCDIAYELEAPYIRPDAACVSVEQPTFDTEEVAPHVVFTPYLRALAAEIVGEETNPLIKARKIYDFITTQCVYRFMPAYAVIDNIPEYFLSGQRGDCGVQAITFITLCRLCGIPARWQAGLETKPNGTGHHDWARFYVAPYGWLFADCSFGGSAYRAGSEERHEFYFGNLEPWRLPFCSDFQQELNPPKRFMRYDPYDNQGGEIETLTRALCEDEYDTGSSVISYEEI